ncbi:ead/Ea22-like family protein, partial [Escherichia coli]|nr:ead/Ea22-like family protein [Escherichia coli]
INSQALREAAEQAMHDDWGFDADLFHELVTPSIVLELLDERERNQQYIKRRDQENEDIALTVGKLLIENGRLVADTLRHLADNEIDSDYFAITSTNEN